MKAFFILITVNVFCSGLANASGNQTLPGCSNPPYNNEIARLVTEALENARQFMTTGVPAVGIPPLDPFGPLPAINFSVNNEALQLDGFVDETTVRNLAEFIICKVDIQLGVTQKMYFEFRLDNFHVNGKYDVNGLAVSLFPIFGNGNFELDTYESGFSGFAKVSYNVIKDRITISDLALDIFFEELELYLECILGCGQMADFMNSHLGDIGEAIFDATWDYISPVISDAIENVVNEALQDVPISELIPKTHHSKDLGNANSFMDTVLNLASNEIVAAGYDPAALIDRQTELDSAKVMKTVNASLDGLSTVRRSGTSTVEKVVDWLYLYTNIAIGQLKATYPGHVYENGVNSTFVASLSLDVVDVYMTGRANIFSKVFDIDQFVISDLGPVNAEIEGLGALGSTVEIVIDTLSSWFLEDIQALLSDVVKQAIQEALHETPWPDEM